MTQAKIVLLFFHIIFNLSLCIPWILNFPPVHGISSQAVTDFWSLLGSPIRSLLAYLFMCFEWIAFAWAMECQLLTPKGFRFDLLRNAAYTQRD